MGKSSRNSGEKEQQLASGDFLARSADSGKPASAGSGFRGPC